MSTIHLKISGDGRNMGQKVKHVMITIALLDDSTKLFESNYHYTTVLFSETKNYSTLKIATSSLIEELQELSNIEMIINNTCWKFELFFSSDWNKSMNILNENPTAYSGHKLPPLFNMILLENHIPDKLHIMLRITDRLWELFEFWKICDTNNWDYTFLMGDDKFHEKKTDPQYFHSKAKVWYELFLKKTEVDSETNVILVQEFYCSSDVTPYIHVLISHVWEFMLKHQRWGLNAFSCSAVEKKIMTMSVIFLKNS
ncbi:hypothetical protein C1645_841393 [Glomus cerebriforme]|uniref:Uncharacterized protein n=1 Tax=Glomus cerebriforme TaxID=658196 RepID=A0A397RZN2_9GLOM|nr:hypothetical protein C1645_841393 [Glomus cerebriforme]